MQFKNLTIPQLKEKYSERHGFVFAASSPCDNYYCDKVSDEIKRNNGSDSDIEFVVELSPQIFVFVYPDGASFQSGRFYQHTHNLGLVMGFKIDMLANFLKNNG